MRILCPHEVVDGFYECLKAMLQGAIFLATFVATNVALQVARKMSRVTHHFCNVQYQKNVALQVARKVKLSSIFRNRLRDKLLCVTCPKQPATQFCENKPIRERLLRLAADFKMVAGGRVVNNECSLVEIPLNYKKLSYKEKIELLKDYKALPLSSLLAIYGLIQTVPSLS